MTRNLFANRLFVPLLKGSRGVFVFAGALLIAVGSFGSSGFAKDEAKLKTAKAPAKTHKPWIKLCPKMPKGAKKKLCVTRADYLDRANMVPYAPIAIEDIDGKKSIVVTLPNIWIVPVQRKDKKTGKVQKGLQRVGARWAILSGVIVKVDENKIHKLKYVYCDQFGCVAQAKLTDKLLKEMKKGKRIFVAGKNGPKTLGLPFTLTGFGKALDGKASDEVAYRKAWQAQMASIRKQQIAMAKKQRAAAQKKK